MHDPSSGIDEDLAGWWGDRYAQGLCKSFGHGSERSSSGPVLWSFVCVPRSPWRPDKEVIWWDGQGACLFSKRLERGRFVWPSAADGKLTITTAQLSMLLEGIDWNTPQRTWRPLTAG